MTLDEYVIERKSEFQRFYMHCLREGRKQARDKQDWERLLEAWRRGPDMAPRADEENR